jgi:hypothetical protein
LRGGVDPTGKPVTYIVSMCKADPKDTRYQELHTLKMLVKKEPHGDQLARSAILSKDGQNEIDDEWAFYYLVLRDK